MDGRDVVSRVNVDKSNLGGAIDHGEAVEWCWVVAWGDGIMGMVVSPVLKNKELKLRKCEKGVRPYYKVWNMAFHFIISMILPDADLSPLLPLPRRHAFLESFWIAHVFIHQVFVSCESDSIIRFISCIPYFSWYNSPLLIK